MNQTEPMNAQTVELEDLTACNDEEIKGGPSTQSKRAVVLKCDVAGVQLDVDE